VSDWKRRIAETLFDWQFKKPIGKKETIPCPECGGNLHLDQMADTGIVNGACEKPDCLIFSIPDITTIRRMAKGLGVTKYD
jgi:hypothetical protein